MTFARSQVLFEARQSKTVPDGGPLRFVRVVKVKVLPSTLNENVLPGPGAMLIGLFATSM